MRSGLNYLRVSSRRQVDKGFDEDGLSLPAQREACARYAGMPYTLAVAERRRTQACLTRLGIQDPSVTAEHVRDWVRAEDAFAAVWQDLMTFQQAHPS
jgi:hypothetical protein